MANLSIAYTKISAFEGAVHGALVITFDDGREVVFRGGPNANDPTKLDALFMSGAQARAEGNDLDPNQIVTTQALGTMSDEKAWAVLQGLRDDVAIPIQRGDIPYVPYSLNPFEDVTNSNSVAWLGAKYFGFEFDPNNRPIDPRYGNPILAPGLGNELPGISKAYIEERRKKFGALSTIGDYLLNVLGIGNAYGAEGSTFGFCVDPSTNTSYLASRSWRAPRGDPLTLDLDGDGIETTALSTTSPILFDLNADGVKTGTGWLKPDDGFLALDRNGNGLIDNGRELFGDATPLTAGGTAHDGLAALADLDTNHDGRIDSDDAQFTQLRVWRDLNQDGISQANELTSLAASGVSAIDLTRTANTTNLANGNQIADQAAFLKTDNTTGGVGSMADVNLAGNPFYSDFTDILDTSAVADLPDMQGAGMVRDLKEAASLSGELAGTLGGLSGYRSRAELYDALDGVIAQWADTSAMDTSIEQAAANGMKLLYLAPGETIQDAVQIDNMAGEPGELSPAEAARRAALKAKQEHLTALIGLLEKYNGQTFVTVNAHSVTTGTGAEVIGVTTVGSYETGFPLAAMPLSQPQADLLEQSYAELKGAVYNGVATSANDPIWSLCA